MTAEQLTLEPVPPVTAGTSRAADRWTSRQAARSVDPSPDQARCLDALRANGGRGSIDTVCDAIPDRDRGCLSRRLTDLAEMGAIRAGDPVMGSRGRWVTEWEVVAP